MVDELLKPYFTESAGWDIDRSAQTVRRERIAWGVAAAGWLLAAASATALVLLIPLKSVEPYVIRVDNSTGVVDVVPMYVGHAEIRETVVRLLLTHYVTLCEGFNYATAERDYEECGAFHTAKRNQEWSSLWMPSNPSSPLNLYKDGTTVHVQVTALTFFRRSNGLIDVAQARYVKFRRLAGGSEVPSHWIATIQYAFVSPSRDPRTRQWNPLGFKVIDFRSEPESIPAETTTVSSPHS